MIWKHNVSPFDDLGKNCCIFHLFVCFFLCFFTYFSYPFPLGAQSQPIFCMEAKETANHFQLHSFRSRNLFTDSLIVLSLSLAKSRGCRMAEVGRRHLDPSGPTSAQAGTSRAGFAGPHLGDFWGWTSEPLWASYSSAPSSARLKSAFWCSDGTFYFPVCASCPGTGHHWNEPGSILFALSLQMFIDIFKISPEPSPDWVVPVLSAFPHSRGTPVSWPSWWPCVGLFSCISPFLL